MSNKNIKFVFFTLLAIASILLLRTCYSIPEAIATNEIETVQGVESSEVETITVRDTIREPYEVTRWKTEHTIIEKPILAFQIKVDSSRVKELEEQLEIANAIIKSKSLEMAEVLDRLQDAETKSNRVLKEAKVYDNEDYTLTIGAKAHNDSLYLSHNYIAKPKEPTNQEHKYYFGIGGGMRIFRDANETTKVRFLPTASLKVKDHLILGGVDPINGSGIIQYNHTIGFDKWK